MKAVKNCLLWSIWSRPFFSNFMLPRTRKVEVQSYLSRDFRECNKIYSEISDLGTDTKGKRHALKGKAYKLKQFTDCWFISLHHPYNWEVPKNKERNRAGSPPLYYWWIHITASVIWGSRGHTRDRPSHSTMITNVQWQTPYCNIECKWSVCDTRHNCDRYFDLHFVVLCGLTAIRPIDVQGSNCSLSRGFGYKKKTRKFYLNNPLIYMSLCH